MRQQKLKTFVVSVVIEKQTHYEVKAHNEKEAISQALEGKGEISNSLEEVTLAEVIEGGK